MASSCRRKRRPQPLPWLLGSTLLLLQGCATTPRRAYEGSAERNRSSLYSLPIDLFGREEVGWAVYAPRLAASLDTAAPADSPAFASAVARWRARHGLGGGGVVDEPLLRAVKSSWQDERPFVRLRAQGVCPPPPSPTALAPLPMEDNLGGRPLLIRPGALFAYERMVAVAREDVPALALRPDLLRIFSAYRDPERDAARCASEGNCQGVVRAACSAHRTGLALDLALDTAPGQPVDSSADVNRLVMSRGEAYRWLVANAARFGFVNYAFEPWHWEWTGEAP